MKLNNLEREQRSDNKFDYIVLLLSFLFPVFDFQFIQVGLGMIAKHL